MSKFVGLDANETVYFSGQLEQIKARSYDTKWPGMKLLNGGLIPIDMSAGPAAAVIKYRSYTSAGIAQFISNYATDFPRADVSGVEEYVKPKSIGSSYGYSIQEIREAAREGRPLTAQKAEAARRAVEMFMNKKGILARTTNADDAGLIGLVYQPNVTAGQVAVETAAYHWHDKTASAIITDVNTLCNKPQSLTKGVEIPDTFLCPIAQMTILATTRVSQYSDTTILEFVKRVNPHIKTWETMEELAAVDPIPSSGAAGPVDIAMVYTNNSQCLEMLIPQPFEQFPEQQQGLEITIPCHARFAGVVVYYPLSIAIAENI